MEKTSEHASISFTAHYTGEMWQKLGLSHPALATKKGKQLHRLLSPIEWFANTFFGVTTNKTLTARHQLMDEVAEAFIAKHPNVQIVEIAAGLSPRGWRFLQKHPNISYTEIDLPAMSALKQEKSTQLPKPTPNFYAMNVINDDLEAFFCQLDTSKPVLIITEGLINYFSMDVLAGLANNLATQMAKFTNNLWVTENYPLSTSKSYNNLVNTASKVLSQLTKSSFSFYFLEPKEAIMYFQQNGFNTIDVFQPSQGLQANNQQHLGDTVWVVSLSV